MNCLYIDTATGIMTIVIKIAKRNDNNNDDNDTPLWNSLVNGTWLFL